MRQRTRGIRSFVRRRLEAFLPRFGYYLVPDRLIYDWQKAAADGARIASDTLPEGASAYLESDNHRLRELRSAYAQFGGAATVPSVWTPNYLAPEDILYFRADNPYVWQLRGRDFNEFSYALTYYYTKSIDRMGLLDRLHEDRLFGVRTFETDGRLISRDLLDSVSEINFLDRALNISRRPGTVILDIGSGYGRLAHRTTEGISSISHYLCTDAIAESSFVCEYYLKFRRVDSRAQVIPLHEIDSKLRDLSVDLAVNIHSFSECRLEAIDWWVSLLKRHAVRHVMIVPNQVAPDGKTMLTTSGQDFSTILHAHGYRLTVQENKYTDALVRRYAVNPSTYFLFSCV
jgi:hypothetical protein